MKIDQAFVADAISNRDARKVVRASASLGRELGLKVVAEGRGNRGHGASRAGCRMPGRARLVVWTRSPAVRYSRRTSSCRLRLPALSR